LKKETWWKIKGKIKIAGRVTTAEQFVENEAQLFTLADSKERIFFVMKHRFARISRAKPYHIDLSEAEFIDTKKTEKGELNPKWRKRIKKKKGKKKRKREVERMFGKNKEKDNQEGKQMSFDF